MSENAGGVSGEGGFELARAFVSVNPDAASFEESLEEQIGEINYVVQIPVVADAEDLPSQVQSAADASNAAITVPVVADAEGLPEQVQAAADAARTEIVLPVVAETAGLAEQVAAEGEAASAAFSEKLLSVSSGVDLFPQAADLDAKAAAAGGEAGGAFASAFTASAIPDSAWAGLWEKIDAEAAASGRTAASAFTSAFESGSGKETIGGVVNGGEAAAGAAEAGEEAADSFGERFTSALMRLSLIPSLVPVAVRDAAEAGAEAATSFGERFTESVMRLSLIPSLIPGAVRDAAEAGEEAAAGFGQRFAEMVARISLIPSLLPELVKDAGSAAADAASEFGSRFVSMLSGFSLFGRLFSVEALQDAAAAGLAAADTFGERFVAILGKVTLLPSLIPDAVKDAASAGLSAGQSFVSSMKSALTGNFMEIALGAGFVAATAYMSSEFQAAMERIHTQAGVAQSAIDGLSSGVLSLAGQVGESPDSLAAALYHVESSFQSVGITGQGAMEILRVAAEGARTGNANLVDVTNALDATIAAGIPGINNYSQAMGALNAIVGSGDMTMQDLANAMGTGLMAQAKMYGQSIEQVGAALATLGDNNIRGAKAATDLRMTWQAVQAPLKTSSGLLQSLGLQYNTLADTMEHHGLTAALQEFVDHLKASKVPVSDWGQYVTEIFGKRAGTGIGVLIDQLGRFEGKLPDVAKGAADFGNAWTSTTKTTKQELADVESGFEALGIKIGDKLLPYVDKFLTMIRQDLPAIEHFGEEVGHLVAPAVGIFFSGLAEDLKIAFGPMRDLTITVGALTAAWIAFDIATDANPVMLIALGIIALTGVIVKFHTQIGYFLEDTGAAFIELGKTGLEALKGLTDAFLDFTQATIDGAVKAFGWIPGIGGELKDAAKGFGDFKDSVNDSFNNMISTMSGWQKSLTASQTDSAAMTSAIDKDFSNQAQGAEDARKSLSDYTTQIQQNGVTSQQAEAARSQLIKDLQNAGVNSETAKKDVGDYTNAVQQNGVQSNQAKAARQQLITDIINADTNSKKGKNDLQAYTKAVEDNGSTSDSAKAARQQLIKDLENAGLTSQQATKLVDGLTTSIKNIPASKSLSLTESATGTWSISEANDPIAKNSIQDKLTEGGKLASGGLIRGGSGRRNADDIPAMLSHNEYVMNSDAVSHYGAGFMEAINSQKLARGGLAVGGDGASALRSFAGGGLVSGNYNGSDPSQMGSWLTGEYNQTTQATIASLEAIVQSAVNAAREQAQAALAASAGGGISGAGVSNSSAEAALKSAAAEAGWTGAQWQALYDVEMREAGFSLTAKNPSSGAYGLAQFIDGPSEYAQYGGDVGTAAGQAVAMVNYVKQRYGDPEAAEAHEQEYGWYDSGGYLPPGRSVALNGTGGPERVLPPGTDVMPANEVQAAMARSGDAREVTVNFNGISQFPSPEQIQAIQLALSAAVGVA